MSLNYIESDELFNEEEKNYFNEYFNQYNEKIEKNDSIEKMSKNVNIPKNYKIIEINKFPKINIFDKTNYNNFKLELVEISIEFLNYDKNFISIHDIIQNISQSYLSLKTSYGITIYTIMLKFLLDLYPCTYYSNKIIINIDQEIFLNNIIFEKVDNPNFAIYYDIINNNNLQNTKFKFDIKLKVFENNLVFPDLCIFQQLETFKINTFENEIINLEKNKVIMFNDEIIIERQLANILMCKGIFINESIDLFLSISLYLNGNEYFCYDQILLYVVCKKINEKMFYIPFDTSIDYYDSDPNTYLASINFSRIDIAKINFKIKKNNSLNDFYIHFLVANQLCKSNYLVLAPKYVHKK